MLSSMAHTRETLETSESSQLSASGERPGIEDVAGALQLILLKADAYQGGGDGECVFDAGRGQPVGQSLFGIRLLQGAEGGGVAAAQGVFQQLFHAIELLAIFGLVAEAEAEPLQAEQVFTQLGGGAFGGGAGLCNSCIRPAARVPKETSFSRCSAST